MALPKLNTQTYELEVPSTDEKIRYRPKKKRYYFRHKKGVMVRLWTLLLTLLKVVLLAK